MFALADALIRQGNTVAYIGPDDPDVGRIEKLYPVEHLPTMVGLGARGMPSYRSALLAWIRHGRSTVRSFHPDLVLVNGVLPFRLPGRTIAIAHDIEREGRGGSQLQSTYKRWSYRRLDGVAATCSEVADALRAQLRDDGLPISLLPNSVPLGHASALVDREQLVLHIGTERYKNPIATIDAFLLADVPGSELAVIGARTAELDDYVARLAPRWKCRVRLLGRLPGEEFVKLIGQARVVAVPSVYAVPVQSPTVLDAFTRGTPVVASCISRDLLKHGVNGLALDSPVDPAMMADGLRSLLEDDDLWLALSEGAVRSVEALQPERVAREVLRLASTGRVATSQS